MLRASLFTSQFKQLKKNSDNDNPDWMSAIKFYYN